MVSQQRSRLRPWRWAGVGFLFFWAFSGCDSGNDPAGSDPSSNPVPASLALAPHAVTMLAGEATILSTVVHDENGIQLTTSDVTFLTRDSTTATVDQRGEVYSLAGGETRIVAALGDLRDSAAVTVRYPVEEGQGRARIRGPGDYEVEWVANGLFMDVMGTEEDDRFSLSMLNTARVDTGVVVLLPGGPKEGRFDLSDLSVDAFLEADLFSELEGAVAYLITETDEEIRVYLGLSGSHLTLEEVIVDEGIGTSGGVRGRLVMEAAGYRLGPGGWGEENSTYATGDTVMIYADLAAEFFHWGIGRAAVTLEGGPADGAYPEAEAWWSGEDWVAPDYSSIILELGGLDINIFMPYPEVGVFPLDSLGPTYSLPETARTVLLENWDWDSDWEYGWNTDGTLTIEEVIPSTGETWGQVKGSMSANLLYGSSWLDPPTDGGSAIVKFHAVQVPASSWVPSQVADARERGPWFWPLPAPVKSQRTRNSH